MFGNRRQRSLQPFFIQGFGIWGRYSKVDWFAKILVEYGPSTYLLKCTIMLKESFKVGLIVKLEIILSRHVDVSF